MKLSQRAEDVLLQRGPMLRLERFEVSEEGVTLGSFSIEKEDPFLEEGFLPEEAILESLAQTVAAGQGFLSRSAQEEPALGLLTGFERVEFLAGVREGDELRTRVELQSQLGSFLVMDCEAWVEKRTVVRGTLKFFLQPNETDSANGTF